MRKTPFLITTLLMISFFVTAALDMPFAFVMSFAGLAYIGSAMIFFILIWWCLPSERKKFFAANKKRYCLFCIGVWLIALIGIAVGRFFIYNQYFLISEKSIKIAAKAVLVLYPLFISWNIVRQTRKKLCITLIAVWVAFFVFTFVKSKINLSKTDDATQISTLQSLPYLAWTPLGDKDKSLVTTHDPNLAQEGINVYSPMSRSATYLMDMKGNYLHKWSLGRKNKNYGAYSHVMKNGDLLTYTKASVKCLDWDSNVKWKYEMAAHHEVTVAENGDIYVFGMRDKVVFINMIPTLIKTEYIAILSSDGKLLREIPLFEATSDYFGIETVKKIYLHLLRPKNIGDIIKKHFDSKLITDDISVMDLLHCNRIQIADRNIEGFCKKNDLLLSIRNLDLIAILDIETNKLTWKWGPGQLSRQHHPTILQNNNVLIFDNGPDRGYSRVVEIEPVSKKIVWEYMADPPENFFSNIRGACQRLPNNNTLITDSESGRAFEITPSGKIVWEFFSPDTDSEMERRSSIYRFVRITNPQNYEKLKDLEY